MTNSKSTKRALWASVLSIVICLTMLIGSTFAWFTDTAATGVNTITSGNLDVKLYYNTDCGTTWTNAESATDIFTTDKWEPGYTQVVYFKVENAGSLAFDYKVATNIVKETAGKNQKGAEFNLSDYLQFGIVETSTAFVDRDSARNAITVANKFSSVGFGESTLEKGKSAIFAMVVWMPEDTTNDANHNGVNRPEIQFGVNVIASQATVENDSFNNEYDEDAKYPTAPELDAVVASAKSLSDLHDLLTAAAEEHKETFVINIENDYELTEGDTWEAITNMWGEGTQIVINGNGHTIYGLTAPLFTATAGGSSTFTVNDLTITKATISGNYGSCNAVGAFLAYSDASGQITLNNCHLTDSTVTATTGGVYAGGLIGYTSAPATISNCSVTGCTISGEKSVGAIIGHIGAAVTISDVTATNNTLTVTTAGRELGVGAIFGRSNGGSTITMTNITISGNTLTQEGATSDRVSDYYGKNYGTTTLNGSTI